MGNGIASVIEKPFGSPAAQPEPISLLPPTPDFPVKAAKNVARRTLAH